MSTFFLFGILMNVCSVMYYIFLHTDPYEHVGKKEKKEKKRKLKICTSQTRTQLHTDKKERKKHTPSTFFSIYMKK